jgi:hypothetical protein
MNPDSSQPMAQRLLVATLPAALFAAAERAAAHQGVALDVFLLDSIVGLAAMMDAGIAVHVPVPVPVSGPETPRLVHARLPNWAMDLPDVMVGSSPHLADRAAVVRTAVAVHLDNLDSWDTIFQALRDDVEPAHTASWRAMFNSAARAKATSGAHERVTLGRRDSLDDDVRRAQRARARLSGLASSRAMGPEPLPVSVLAAPDDVMHVAPLPPSEVLIGLAHEITGRALNCDGFAPLPRDRSQEEMSLYGLTNRVSPTLWAASCLIEMQVYRGGEPVAYSDFLMWVMPEAWRIGAGVEKWEALQRPNLGAPTRRFLSSARWPSVPDQSDPERAERREASTVYGFVEYALLIWMAGARKMRAGGGRGPLIALGLVDPSAREDGAVFLSATSAAVRLAVGLERAGASCEYPHNADSWSAYEEFLAEANPLELQRMDTMLDVIATAEDRAGVFRGVARIDPQAQETVSGSATLANGYIARLREWGLIEPARPKFGVKALTTRGLGELDNARNTGRVLQ